jgi:hypothetical protein
MHETSSVVNLREPKKQEKPAEVFVAPPPPPKRRKLPVFVPIIAVLVLLSLGVGAYFQFFRSSPSSDDQQSENPAAEMEVRDLIVAISKLIVLPKGEEPTVATVTDPKKLDDQTFFKDAKAGDKVLLYTKARKAYLYRPSLNLLIEVAPITTGVQ